MNNIISQLKNDLHLFHQASKIPFCVFDNSPHDLFRCPRLDSMDCSPKTLQQCCDILSKTSHPLHLPLLYSSGNCFAALMKLNENTNIMFGPVSSIPVTYKEFYATNKNISDMEDLTHLYRIIQQSPHITLERFASNIALFIKLAFQEVITPQEILTNHSSAIISNIKQESSVIAEPHYLTISEAITLQKEILFHIQNGNKHEIEKLFRDTHFYTNLENNYFSFDEVKKIFFIYTTICCAAAMEEGLDIKKSFPILDTYISQIPSLSTPSDLAELCLQVSLDYCEQINNLHNNYSSSPLVIKCLQYIQDNIYSKITLDDLAQHCNVSKRTITRHFTEYHHISVAEYILQIKLKEAAFLLEHSNFSLAEISTQLAFSSQSHFSVAFKKKYLYTPQQYREKSKTPPASL